MADSISVIPSTVLRNLSDKLYEKRRNAALEIEGIVKKLASAGDHEKISVVINLLTTVFTYSPQVEHRKGGLIGLAAATTGLTTEAAQHLEEIVPPVLNSFSDRDSRVRYYACEALYNIAKVIRGDLIIFFNHIFDALWRLSADSDLNVQNAAHLLNHLVKDIVTESDRFSIEKFIPLLREPMYAFNPYVRQFLIGWITFLDSVPNIDMLDFLSDFLDGLFNMLSDSSNEIRQQADSVLSDFLQQITNSLTLPLKSVDYRCMAEILVQRAASPDEFTRLTAITWINEFVKLGRDQLVPYYADILGAILPCIADKDERIRVVAHEASEELLAITADPAEGFDVGAILSIAGRQVSSEWEATQIEALHWISTILNRHRTEPIANTEQNDELRPTVVSHDRVIDIESDSNVYHRTQGSKRNGWTQKVALEWIFVIINLILEIPSAVLDQLSSEHKPQLLVKPMNSFLQSKWIQQMDFTSE